MQVSLGLGLALALVAGFVLGGVGPRRELSRVRVEMAGLTERLGQQRGQASPLSLLLPVPELRCPEPGGGVAEQVIERPHGPDEPSREQFQPPADARADGRFARGMGTGPEPKRSPAEQIEVLRTAQRARIRQARAALQEQAGLSSREMGELDALTRKLNSDLERAAQTLFARGDEPSSLDLLGAVNEASGILYEGQSALEGLVGPSISQVDDSVREIFNYLEIPTVLLERDLRVGQRDDDAEPEPPSAPGATERPGP